MARRSQCSESGDNPLDPNYLPPHYKEEYRLAVDALIEEDLDGYYKFLQYADVVDFLAPSEIEYIQTSIQLPQQSAHPDNRYLDTVGDGSSDTYWPMHSDLDAPGLDLGWPQIHHLIGPTEVTTLVNPAAPDMPSIKEQARRLIKKAQMVIAVVMDVFTDVDIFADILNAAKRNVAVYLLLDEANVQYFINMVNNCRVNVEAIQSLRVRTVTGISYHCRTGKSFKGQMLDRFILTDCRAVLSGNYSFMWSYEKLHRCMAHLFLGQLVSTFDEEFRILYAQSEPLCIKNMEDMTILPKQPYPAERPMLQGKYAPGQPEEWNRAPYEENMDWRTAQVKRQEGFHGPMDIYNRYSSPQSRVEPQTRLEPPFDQGPSRIMEGLPHKRHHFGEGGPGRYGLPYQQPGLPEVEPPGRPFYRGQQHHLSGHEPDYGGYGQADKFWNQGFEQEDPYPEHGYPREIDAQNFDPVLNYLSSSRNVDIEQSSDKLIPGPDLPHATSHPRRHIGQPYACQTSPTPSNTTEKKFMQDHASDRKDPTVKKGLRNWRISSYLSAYDSSGEPEGLPMGQGQIVDPFEDFSHPIQQPTPPPPQAVDSAISKIPNVREFKVPALPRASQMPAYGKTTQRDLPKKIPDEIPQLVVVPEPKPPTPTPSDSSSTTDGEKQEEFEQREPIPSALKRDDSFRGKYNPPVQRSSRLRSSLIFRTLDQSNPLDNSEQDEDKTETDQTKLPFGSQKRSSAREPFEWRSYIKSSDNSKIEEDAGKQAGKDSEQMESLSEHEKVTKSTEEKTKDVAKSSDVAPKVDKLPQIERPKIEQPPLPPVQQPSVPLLSEPFLDMNDPDQRFLFFKELAAKRRAEKAAEEAKLKQKSATKEKKDEPRIEKPVQKDSASPKDETTKEDSKKSDGKTLDLSVKIEKDYSGIKENLDTKVTTDSEKIEVKQSQPSQPTSTEKLSQENQAPQTLDTSKDIEKQDKLKYDTKPNIFTNEQVVQGNQPKTTDATSKEPQLKNSNSVPDFTKKIGLDLLSSLPSARLYERSQLQDASKEVKSRLWSPSIHTREFLKPLSNKKNNSTVIQIEEASETMASDASKNQDKLVKFEIGDKTETSQQSAKTHSESEQPEKEKTFEKSDSCGIETTKDSEEASSSLSLPSVTTVLPAISEKAKPEKPINEGESVVSTSITNEKSVTPSVKDTTISEKAKTQHAESVAKSNQPKDPSGIERSNVEQVEDSTQMSVGQECLDDSQQVEPQRQDIIAAKSNNNEQESTKLANPKEVVKTIEMSDDSLSTSQTPAKSMDKIKNVKVTALGSPDDSNKVDAVEKKANSSKDLSVIEEKSSSTLSFDKTDPVPLPIGETKLKYLITYPEEFPQLESHSDTSSPASFATALEFISSEDSDITSSGKNDPQHLFKSGNLESSVSDMSDFGTPYSDLSRSPMPSTHYMIDTFEDNVSIAETVIEAVSRKTPAATEETKGAKEGDVDTSNSKEIDGIPPETSFHSSNSTSAQSEAKSQDGNTQLAKTIEVTECGSVSTQVKTQDLTSQSETCAVLSKDVMASPAPSEENNEKTLEDKAADIATTLMSTKGSKESIESKVSSIKGVDEESSTNPTRTNVTEDITTGDIKISSQDSEASKKVYSRFQSEPRNALAETKVNTEGAREIKTEDQTLEIKEQLEPIIEETSLGSMTAGLGPRLQESESETRPVVSHANNDLIKVETNVSPATSKEDKTVDKPSVNIDLSETDVSSNASEVSQSQTRSLTSKVAKETETLDASNTTKNAGKPAETDIYSEINQSKIQSSATSDLITDDRTADEKESKIVNKESFKSGGGENEQKSKGANDNTKENTFESAKTLETAPSTAQPKQPKSRYLTSTANVISSSNLRDDTKILLEQISANSQTRNESSSAKEAPVTDDEKEDEADKNGQRKNDLRSSLGQQKSSQERDKLLERIQTMRKDRKVYSRFEV